MLRLKITLLIVIIAAINSFILSEQTDRPKNILVLFALNPGTPAYRIIQEGIRQKLIEESIISNNIYIEYLEIDKYPEESKLKEKFNLYNNKYENIQLDLLICIGRNIVPSVKNFADSSLLRIPVISFDLDFSSYGYKPDLKLNEHTAELGLKLNISKTISYSLNLFPSVSTIYFISGSSSFDQFLMALTMKIGGKTAPDKKLVFLSDLEMGGILNQVRDLPANSLIIISGFTNDRDSVPYYNTEAARLLRREANVPVFTYSDVGVGDGALGGYILSFNKAGLFLGDAALKILLGADPNSIKISENDYYEYLFDWRELNRWNIKNSELIPLESRMLYKEVNVLDRYKWIIGAGIIFLVLQTFLIISLIRLNKNKSVISKKMLEADKRYRDLLHEDRGLRIGHLTSSLSHELNQPLTGILSTAQAGINFINSDNATPELIKQLLQKIVANTKRTASILSSIRGMMRLESREKEIVNLNILLDEVVDVYRSEALKFNTGINLKLSKEPAYILADRVQIQQVILNFIQNALQSMEKINGNGKVIDVIESIQDGEVTVSVRDFGKGIDKSVKENLFKPFITSKKEGSGIGLVICRSIIEDHQGKIWADNKPDGGAEFSFSLKL